MHAYDAFHRHGGPSATPIYDALYAEYVRSFRSLPGDRSGEEELGFTAFRSIPRGRGAHSAYSAGARLGQQSVWQRVPAALPPAPRSGS
ncbi:hypothetical protein [Streptomyces sp. AC627_RSS907]|uniref:hypothetical protein n=1 Tax=Streptomyces sp. AC627_RSS907 TaxID=2823684 RepID=UPI001C24F1F1|nr:hypothetical protein [Streptomyces sp. AC627_RSS907]